MFLGSVEGVDFCELLIFIKDPIIVDVWIAVFRDFDRWIFVIELLLGLFKIELRQVRLLLGDFFFLSALLRTVIHRILLVFYIFPLLVVFNVILVSLVEFVLLVGEELLAGHLTSSLLLFTLRLDLSVKLVNSLASDHVLLARINSHLEPAEDLAHVCVVSINFLLGERLYDLLTVVDRLVGCEIFGLLTVDLVGEHPLRQLLLKQFLSLLPTHLVCLRLTDVVSLELVQEEHGLYDLGHLEHTERLYVR